MRTCFATLVAIAAATSPSLAWAEGGVNAGRGECGSSTNEDTQRYVGTLPNGVRIILEQTPGDMGDGIEIRFRVMNAGNNIGRLDEAGIAHLIEHLGYEGSKELPGGELRARAAAGGVIGSKLQAFTTLNSTLYTFSMGCRSGLSSKATAHFLKEIAVNLSFDADAIEKQKALVIAEASNGTATDPIGWEGPKVIVTASEQRSAMERITRSRLLEYYHNTYRPSNFVIIVAGNIDVPRWREALTAQFGILADSQLNLYPRNDQAAPPKSNEPRFVFTGDGQHGMVTAVFMQPAEAPGDPAEPLEMKKRFLRQLVSEAMLQRDKVLTASNGRAINGRVVGPTDIPTAPFLLADVLQYNASYAQSDPEQAAQQLVLTLRQLRDGGLTSTEFSRAKKKLEREIAAQDGQAKVIADRISEAIEFDRFPKRAWTAANAEAVLSSITLDETNAFLASLIDFSVVPKVIYRSNQYAEQSYSSELARWIKAPSESYEEPPTIDRLFSPRQPAGAKWTPVSEGPILEFGSLGHMNVGIAAPIGSLTGKRTILKFVGPTSSPSSAKLRSTSLAQMSSKVELLPEGLDQRAVRDWLSANGLEGRVTASPEISVFEIVSESNDLNASLQYACAAFSQTTIVNSVGGVTAINGASLFDRNPSWSSRRAAQDSSGKEIGGTWKQYLDFKPSYLMIAGPISRDDVIGQLEEFSRCFPADSSHQPKQGPLEDISADNWVEAPNSSAAQVQSARYVSLAKPLTLEDIAILKVVRAYLEERLRQELRVNRGRAYFRGVALGLQAGVSRPQTSADFRIWYQEAYGEVPALDKVVEAIVDDLRAGRISEEEFVSAKKGYQADIDFDEKSTRFWLDRLDYSFAEGVAIGTDYVDPIPNMSKDGFLKKVAKLLDGAATGFSLTPVSR